MKLSLRNAILILLAGLLILAIGSYMDASKTQLSNPVVLSGLAVEFIGTIWLVLSMNQRRRRPKI